MHPPAKKLQKRRSGASATPAHGGHGPIGWPPAWRRTAAPGGHPAARPRNRPRFRLPQGPFGTPAAAVLQVRPTRGRKKGCGTTRCAAGGRAQQPPAASPPPAPPATGPRDAHGNTTRHPRAAPKWPRTRARNASFARKICQCCTFVVILCRKYNII